MAALDLLRVAQFAVILADQRMPGLTGDQFLAQAQKLSDATRILVTGYTDIEALIRAVNEVKFILTFPSPGTRSNCGFSSWRRPTTAMRRSAKKRPPNS